MTRFESELNSLLERTKEIKSPINAASLGTNISEYNRPSEDWINDVEIFYNKYLKDHSLGKRISTILFHRQLSAYNELVSCLTSISKDQDFIEAARAIGCNDKAIIFQYIIPNALAPIIVQATLGLAGAILSIAGLSFLGLGIQPPTPEWGAMLSNARVYIRDAWHVTVIPGLGIMLTFLSLNLMGDGLRDAMDPKLKS